MMNILVDLFDVKSIFSFEIISIYFIELQIIRKLIRFIPKLPQQAAFCLYNYIIGYIMFYVRHPKEKCQELIGQALATLWMVVHSVQGIMFKDLKQILRKEQVGILSVLCV